MSSSESAAWRAHRPSRPQVTATVGASRHRALDGGIARFQDGVSLDGEPLTAAETEQLIARPAASLMRGRWVEVDRDRLSG